MATKRYQETEAVKKALKAGGFPDITVRHGTGTAWNWIEATIHEPYNRQRLDLAERIVLKASGRDRLVKYDDPMTDYNASNVCVDMVPKKVRPLEAKEPGSYLIRRM